MRVDYSSRFFCTKCGIELPYSIPRFSGKERPAGHLKKIWCMNCQKETNHCECKGKFTPQCFYLEFKYHNYDEEGNRKQPFGIFKDNIMKEGVDIYEEIDCNVWNSR